MKPTQNQKYNKTQNSYQYSRMVYLDNGMIGWDGENFFRLSPSKKPLGTAIPKYWINQHVINELEYFLSKRQFNGL